MIFTHKKCNNSVIIKPLITPWLQKYSLWSICLPDILCVANSSKCFFFFCLEGVTVCSILVYEEFYWQRQSARLTDRADWIFLQFYQKECCCADSNHTHIKTLVSLSERSNSCVAYSWHIGAMALEAVESGSSPFAQDSNISTAFYIIWYKHSQFPENKTFWGTCDFSYHSEVDSYFPVKCLDIPLAWAAMKCGGFKLLLLSLSCSFCLVLIKIWQCSKMIYLWNLILIYCFQWKELHCSVTNKVAGVAFYPFP